MTAPSRSNLFMEPASVAIAKHFALFNWGRPGQRLNTTDRRGARRQGHGRRDNGRITLGRSRTTRHGLTGKGVPVRVRCLIAVRQGFQEGHDLVLLLIGQAEIAGRHADRMFHVHKPSRLKMIASAIARLRWQANLTPGISQWLG